MNGKLRFWRRLIAIAVAAAIMVMFGTSMYAQDDAVEEPAAVMMEEVSAGDPFQVQIDTLWILLASMLVFFMQAGFAFLEAGLIRQTGVVNSLMENFMDAAITGIVFWAVGFGIAFGTSAGGFIGTSNFFLSEAISVVDGAVVYNPVGEVSMLTLFFFQFAFAATASTIATGAMAERTNFIGKIIYSAIVGALIYPIVVHWVWGGGWLAELGFVDFAGSTVVHATGGVIALIGAAILGPRIGRAFGSGAPQPHNMGFAVLGTLILWLGWYGFNAGSTISMSDSGLVALVAVNTTLAAAAGALTAMFFVYVRTGKWDLPFTLNGSLAGLVGITAGCASVMPWAAIVIGLTAGILVVIVCDVLERAKVDDAVGAFGVHGACGMMGTLAIGFIGSPALGAAALFTGGGVDLLITQVIGVAAVVVYVGVASVVMFSAIKALGVLRISSKADEIGIDVYEHGASAWPDVLPVSEASAAGD
jgi:ammonium transporter, Amt family